jgi:hypothetical protein
LAAAAVPDRRIWLQIWRPCGVLGSFEVNEMIEAAKEISRFSSWLVLEDAAFMQTETHEQVQKSE